MVAVSFCSSPVEVHLLGFCMAAGNKSSCLNIEHQGTVTTRVVSTGPNCNKLSSPWTDNKEPGRPQLPAHSGKTMVGGW